MDTLGDPSAASAFQSSSSRTAPTPPSDSRQPPRSAGSGESRASSSAPSPAPQAAAAPMLPARDVGSEEGIRLSVTLAAALFMGGRTEEAAELCDRAIARVRAAQLPVARASAYWNASVIRSEAGDVSEALVPGQARAAPAGEHRARARHRPAAHPAERDHAAHRPAPARGRQGAAADRGHRAGVERGQPRRPGPQRPASTPRRCYMEGESEQARDRALSGARRRSGELPLVSVDALILLGQVAWSDGRPRGGARLLPPGDRRPHRRRRRPRGRPGLVRARHPGRRGRADRGGRDAYRRAAASTGLGGPRSRWSASRPSRRRARPGARPAGGSR